MRTTDTLLSDLAFPEGPRWRDDRLHFSDMYSRQVVAVGLDAARETIAHVEGDPSGLGWLPDGSMLVVSMRDRRVLRQLPGGELSLHADLSELAEFHCNDMVVDARGRAYVGNFGYDLHGGGPLKEASLILVQPDGGARVVADGLRFPNGSVITDDGKTLVVGETMAARLTAFDIAEDGSLSNRRLWAQLQDVVPDGICLDAEGGIWVASPIGHTVLRVMEGGEVSDRIAIENEAFACMLGGPDRRHLFICTAGTSNPAEAIAAREGRIEVVEVDVPGAGAP